MTLQGNDVQDLDTRWDEHILSISEDENDGILESLYKMPIRESDQLITLLAVYEQEIINISRSRTNRS